MIINKKKIYSRFILIIFFSVIISEDVLPLTQRYFHREDMGYNYSRGTYLIVLADASLESILEDETTGNFIHFKKTQGYKVETIPFDLPGGSSDNLRQYLQWYIEQDSLLEYVLLIGDVNGPFAIPSYTIPSYNESDMDVTDYPYTFFENDDILNPKFFIGRWSIRSQNHLIKIKKRSMQYIKMDYLNDYSFLNNALLVAGNYSDSGTWPVTPVWTSKWLMDELYDYGIANVDTAFFHLDNQQIINPLIESAWNSGVGIINYRGWGDANGWHKPYFHREEVDEDLQNGWYLPIVMSFVCNTGDFGNDVFGNGLPQCFGEILLTAGSINNPKGAAAMIGPSDLDTDTRFNNVMCAVMWDELLEGRIPELAPALHAGKQSLIKEFGELEVNNTNIVEFYHHIYGVLGDPSLPVWLGEPGHMTIDLNVDEPLTSSHIITIITNTESGEPIMDVVGALLYNNELIATGLSNENGQLVIKFENVPDASNLELYLNKSQYFQKSINLTYNSDDGSAAPEHNYEISTTNSNYEYFIIDSESDAENAPVYNWIEINGKGTNLNLTDDSVIQDVAFGFDFQYYGESYDKLTICSNGWASFLPCLSGDPQQSECNTMPYFFNNSIKHPLGPYSMIAPFFDDLDDNNNSEAFDVYFWTNEQDSVIVEWDNVANGQTDENCPECDKESFQLILNGITTSVSDNGEIIFQYKEIYDLDDHGSTIGIESPDKNTGVEYLFNKEYTSSEYSLRDNLAIKFISGNCIGNDCDNCTNDTGDLNGDGNYDVLDISALANCVLAANCNVIENGCASDMNSDGTWNVIDIVALVNCVLNANCS